jgi:arginine exporter protein ArgO
MFDWKGYIANVARNVVSVSSFIGAVAALLDGCVIAGVAFILIYAIVATDEDWYCALDDDNDSDNDTEKKE